jgi:predicted TIM-barrel fold metal-dependent hydrolase
MRIDVHAHYYPHRYLDALARCEAPGLDMLRGLQSGDTQRDLDERLGVMDAAGVGMQILSAGAQGPYFGKTADAIDAARLANDTYAELVQRYTRRFSLFAATPLPHIDAALREMERALDQLEATGVNVPTSVQGKPIVESVFEPFFEELDGRQTILFIHPAGAGACSPHIQDYGFTWAIGAPIEDTVVALQLIVKQIPLRYPRIKIIIPHLGGALPMLLGRLDHMKPLFAAGLAEVPSITARRFWYDTVAHNSVAALRCACETLGIDRLILGSDYPYQRGDYYRGCVTYIQKAGMTAEHANQILEGNATALLGIARS